jgi:hypothetical protein
MAYLAGPRPSSLFWLSAAGPSATLGGSAGTGTGETGGLGGLGGMGGTNRRAAKESPISSAIP